MTCLLRLVDELPVEVGALSVSACVHCATEYDCDKRTYVLLECLALADVHSHFADLILGSRNSM